MTFKEETRLFQHKPAKDKSHLTWMVHYHLAYDGGGSTWHQYYHTKVGALFSAWLHVYVRSWGGSAILYKRE